MRMVYYHLRCACGYSVFHGVLLGWIFTDAAELPLIRAKRRKRDYAAEYGHARRAGAHRYWFPLCERR